MNLRKIISLTMLIAFALLITTSIILYIVPQGRVAYWADWQVLSMNKGQWGSLHINLGILFLITGFFHIIYNWKAITAYMKNKGKQLKIVTLNFNIAVIITFAVAAGTLLEIPPMKTIINFGESIKAQAAEFHGEPPYGNAARSSLQHFSQRMNIDLEKAKKVLRDKGIISISNQITLVDLARINKTSPQQIFNLIKQVSNKENNDRAINTPASGFSRKKLAEICASFNTDINLVISAMAKEDITASHEQTIREIAAENNTSPLAIFDMVKEISGKN